MSESVFNAATVGGQLFGIPTYSGIINTFSGGSVVGTQYYVCANNDPTVLTAGPVASNPNWKLVGEVMVEYSANNAVRIWRSK